MLFNKRLDFVKNAKLSIPAVLADSALRLIFLCGKIGLMRLVYADESCNCYRVLCP